MAQGVSISPEVRAVLERATVEQGRIVRLPEGQLDRALYAAVDKVLKALGGKWNSGVRGHVFADGVGSELTDALGSGFAVDQKKTLEFFETPPPVAKMMADIAGAVSDRMDHAIVVLEPSAGHGNLLAAFAENLDCDGIDRVIAIDIHPANCDVLRAQGIATEIICDDFLDMHKGMMGQDCDVILMNPPFSNNQDIRHVTHAFERWLAPGGILVAIMSAHFTFSTDALSIGFRELLDVVGARDLIQHLPDKSFSSSGTAVSTVMVSMRKASK